MGMVRILPPLPLTAMAFLAKNAFHSSGAQPEMPMNQQADVAGQIESKAVVTPILCQGHDEHTH